MSEFNRFDVLEAWWLYLRGYHTGSGSLLYARLSKLLTYFEPRPGLRSSFDLNENGQTIYYDLVIDNESFVHAPICDDSGFPGNTWYVICCEGVELVVRADSLESAIEAFIDWCDDSKQMGVFWAYEGEDLDEVEGWLVGHTTLDNWNYNHGLPVLGDWYFHEADKELSCILDRYAERQEEGDL
jgi:hypothetical protein